MAETMQVYVVIPDNDRPKAGLRDAYRRPQPQGRGGDRPVVRGTQGRRAAKSVQVSRRTSSMKAARHGCRDQQAHETESWPGPKLVGAADEGGYLRW
jgi:hypothetical protein